MNTRHTLHFFAILNKRFAYVIVFLLGLEALAGAQDPNLANQYFANGEYEKAAALYEKIIENDSRNTFFFNRYVDCMLFLEQYAECESFIKKQIKKSPETSLYYVAYGNLYDRMGKSAEADEQWRKAIDRMAPDHGSINNLAYQFTNLNKYDLAIETYEKGAKLLKEPKLFAMNLAELYRRQGKNAQMITAYLDALEANPASLQNIEYYLARYLAPEELSDLQTQLYTRMQAGQETPEYVELLAWSFIQQKDFKNAFRQIKALDKQYNENGQRIFKLAGDAANAKDYETAIAAYDYIVTEKGQLNSLFFEAKRESMNCRRKKITEGFSYTREELQILEVEYDKFLAQYGKTRQTAHMVLEMAELQALYINNLPKAIALLDELVNTPGLDRNIQARAKMNLADYYLMTGERWESTLLYSQVDKAFKEEQIGQEARFKNAKLSYYNGDFQWAQAQFDVLKASTSKLIANDALDLSVFIMDNLNLDTTSEAISLYAGAELLVFQNRFEEAFARLDTLKTQFPEHSLQDDILYLEAQIFEKKRDFVKAIALYQKITEQYAEDIRADNSLYAMAQLYETRLNDTEKAKSLYEKIFMDYSGSVFAVDARKQFRRLRGDKVQ